MNGITITAPPVEIVARPTPPAWVGLHIGDVTVNWSLMEFFPLDKPVSAWMLARVLTLSLSQDLLLEDPAITIFGTLGDGMAVIRTGDPLRTVEALKQELGIWGLLPIAQIGIGHPSAWQCVHPGPHINLAPLLDVKRFGAIMRQHTEKLAIIVNALTKPVNLPPGDCPPAAK